MSYCIISTGPKYNNMYQIYHTFSVIHDTWQHSFPSKY